jgi:hypothetical protein
VPTEADFTPLPPELHELRDRLRVAGHELVRYGRAHAQAQARQVRHSFQEYEYAIHRISLIDDGTGQIYIAHDARYTSAQLLPETAALYI